MKPVVFISHSAHEPWVSDLCDQLHTALTDAFEPRLDREELAELAVGEDWSDALSDWLHECQAAVILLDKMALTSDWVQAEASAIPSFFTQPQILQ